MKYSGVIFDWDGTLAKTLHLWLAGYRSELEKLGMQLDDQVIVHDLFYEHDKVRAKYPKINNDTYFPLVYEHVYNHVSNLETYDQAQEVLGRLRSARVDLALVSSSRRKLLQAGLEATGLSHYFSTSVAGDDVARLKPHPEPFHLALEQAGLDRERTLILGDSHTDLVAAREAGLDSCLFTPPENALFYDFEKLKAEGPTYCVETLSEFADVILRDK